MGETIELLAAALPLPLAQLVRRALDGKSPVERHLGAYYLGEAALKLAAAVRIRLYLERAIEPEGRVAQRLVCLKLPSVGQWCELLRSTNGELATLETVSDLPLARCARVLGKRQPDWSAVQRFANQVANDGVLNREVARRAVPGGVLGFFDLLTAYRNEVIGHGAQRSDMYCDTFAALLLDALGEVLSCEALFDGLVMARPVVSLDPGGDWVWQHLQGLRAIKTETPASDADSTQLYFVGDELSLSVHPLVVVRDDVLGREQVGFLNRTVLRTRVSTHGLAEEVRRVDYLDYASGDTFSGIDTQEGMRDLLAQSQTADDSDMVQAGAVGLAVGGALGDFELLRELGRGGTGVVYAARQQSMQRVVALKVLEPVVVATPSQLRRFQREIAILARADHPNVVKVLTAGIDAQRHYYAMEYVEGADLARLSRVLATWRRAGVRLREGHLALAARRACELPRDAEQEAEAPPSSLPPVINEGRFIEARLAELFADASDGLQHLHDRGSVHRDVKPANLMLTADAGRVVIMDLGSAHLADDSATITRTGAGLTGTLRYMAPEQLQRQRDLVDGRADVYGLGATLFEVLTGDRLHDGDNEARLVQQILFETPRSLRSSARNAHRSLDAIVETATRKHPDLRYPTARMMAEDLRAAAAGRATWARPQGWMRRASFFARNHRLGAALGAGLAVAAAGGGLWAWNDARVHTTYHQTCVARRGVFAGVHEVSAFEGRNRTCVLTMRGDRVLSATFVNGVGHPVEGPEGAASFEFVYAEDGQLMESIRRRPDGQVGQKHRFAWEGNTLHANVVDRDNIRVSLDGSDVSTYRVEYDARGYPRLISYLSDRGTPRRNADLAFAVALQTDDRGLVTRRTTLGADGSPALGPTGVSSVETSYDDRGYPVEQRYLGTDARAASDRAGVSVLRWGVDERGNRTTETRIGVDDLGIAGEDGCAGWSASHDRSGLVIRWTCVGASGAPSQHRDGWVTRTARYDGFGNPIEERYMDADDRPVRHHDGYARWTARYDDRGHRVEQSYSGVDDAPCLHRDGYARWTAKHDGEGHIVEVAYFGVDGTLAIHRDGVASWQSRYDERGNLLESRYYGVDGALVLNRYGYARRVWRHDERGNLAEIDYYGVDEALRVTLDGHAVLRAKYDDRGRRVEQTYWDVAGHPARDGRDGAYGLRMRYDDVGRVVERVLLGESGGAAETRDGYSLERITYDAYHRIEKRVFLRAAGDEVGVAQADWAAVRDARAGRPGVVVAGALAGGSLRVGDVITRVGNEPIHDPRDLWLAERDAIALTVVVWREGGEVSLQVTPRELRALIAGG